MYSGVLGYKEYIIIVADFENMIIAIVCEKIQKVIYVHTVVYRNYN